MAAAPAPPAWRLPAIIAALALGLVALGVVVVVVGKVPQKLEISRSFHARTAAYQTKDEQVVNDYIDYATVLGEIRTAAANGGDANPDATAEAIWVGAVGPATLSGRVVSLKGDTAEIVNRRQSVPNGQPGTLTVRYQLERSDSAVWRVTHVLNADELYRSYTSTSLQ